MRIWIIKFIVLSQIINTINVMLNREILISSLLNTLTNVGRYNIIQESDAIISRWSEQ